MGAIIETKQLTHIYSQGTPFEHTALDCVDFSAAPGEYLAVIGRTGSGKSTLIQHLNGLLRPTSGQVLFDGGDIWAGKGRARQVRCQVGLVFQYPEYQLFEETVYQDIAFGPKNMGLDADEVDRRVKQSARFVGLEPAVLEKSPFDLSGGQKRRVAIAGVIAMEPRVLVLDEPVDGLDPVMRRQVWSLLMGDVAERGTTVLVSSHNLRELEDVCDHVGLLSRGKVALERSLSDLQGGTVKLQIAFQEETPPALPDGAAVLHADHIGRVYTYIVRGTAEEVEGWFRPLSPLFMETLPLSLEEIFIYEMGGEDYAVRDIAL